jgi:DNA-directed RNA polymerase subunit H (RpoH/RPB5)
MLMPSPGQVQQARQTLEQLSVRTAQLSREGGRMDIKHCGAASRLCVRIDRRSPVYGESSDYMIVMGY